MTVPKDQLVDIYNRNGGDFEKVAAELGISYSDFVKDYGMDMLPPPTPTPARRRQPPADLGKPELRKFMVSQRHCEHPTWPKEHLGAIIRARRQYELGTHEMTTGRDRDWFILYSIPRKDRTGTRKFFHIQH